MKHLLHCLIYFISCLACLSWCIAYIWHSGDQYDFNPYLVIIPLIVAAVFAVMASEKYDEFKDYLEER